MTENDFKINFLKIPKSVITDSIHFYFNYEETVPSTILRMCYHGNRGSNKRGGGHPLAGSVHPSRLTRK